MQVLILPGDGIGPEIANAARRGLEALDARFALGLQLSEGRVGLAALERDGTTWPDAAEAAVRAADLTILGPVDTAAYPSPEEGGVNPSAAVRTRLELYANMRPSRALKGVPALAPGMDVLGTRPTHSEDSSTKRVRGRRYSPVMTRSRGHRRKREGRRFTPSGLPECGFAFASLLPPTQRSSSSSSKSQAKIRPSCDRIIGRCRSFVKRWAGGAADFSATAGFSVTRWKNEGFATTA